MRTQHTYAVAAHRAALNEAAAAWRTQASGAERAALARFQEAHWSWLASDALYETLAEAYGEEDFQRWPARPVWYSSSAPPTPLHPRSTCSQPAHMRRASTATYASNTSPTVSTRACAPRAAVSVSGSTATWPSACHGATSGATGHSSLTATRWGHRRAARIRVGSRGAILCSTPSNTGMGVAGQGPVQHFVAARIDKLLDEFDGVRIDHPHGLVCPWVYRTDIPDAYTAVQTGARLFSSPDVPEHPALARFAITAAEDSTPPAPGMPMAGCTRSARPRWSATPSSLTRSSPQCIAMGTSCDDLQAEGC